MTNYHLMVVAGEVSSDNHASKLIKKLKNLKSGIEITAIGGRRMEQTADFLEENIVDIAAIGFLEVLKYIPFFISLKNRIVKKYFKSGARRQIDGIIFLDYPGFNVRLAKVAAKFNIPVFYYITPQVWAWGKKRAGLLSRICQKLYCVFAFEKDIFKKQGGRAEYVGHPLLEDIPKEFRLEEFNRTLNIEASDKVIAVMPGSRENEVLNHLPVIDKALKGIDARIIVGKSPTVSEATVSEHIDSWGMTENIYTLIKRADFIILSSGTSTLEAAAIGTPFITIYRISRLSYMMAKLLVDIDYVSMVNILAGRRVVPELVQKNFNPKKLKKEVLKFLSDKKLSEKMRDEFIQIRKKLGAGNASQRVAESVIEELEKIRGRRQ
ncbi:MAG: lipid-A-disaccharide synthase [Elusimicrobia bacterium]|jgi:lipid-A-disaccharide synthase|nr:lipid-A-disaccharide synthase [Elusimicrobiota bacterium]